MVDVIKKTPKVLWGLNKLLHIKVLDYIWHLKNITLPKPHQPHWSKFRCLSQSLVCSPLAWSLCHHLVSKTKVNTRSVQRVSSHVKIETFIEQDTRYKKHCTQDNGVSVPFEAGTLGPHTILPISISCLILFSWISSMVWNLFLFKGDFSFGKSQKLKGTKPGL